MKAVLFALALPVLALAGGEESSWAGGAVAPHISVTKYDSPHSSGDSTWIIHTTVSYSVGPGYTSMITGPISTASAGSTGWGASTAPAGSTGWGSSPAVATPTPKAYTGGAGQAVAGAGAVIAAGLAYVL